VSQRAQGRGARDNVAPVRVVPPGGAALDSVIEALWLVSVILVPLTFGPPESFSFFDVPKVALMRLLAALIAGAWAIDVAIGVSTVGFPAFAGWLGRLTAWLRAYPPRLTLVAAGLLLAVTALSVALSPVRTIGLWGFEVGRDGQSLLTTASMLVVFLAIALRLRTSAQLWRLAGALAVGTLLPSLYIVAQALSLDPFDLDRFLPGRVVGSFGNPIFAGAALLQGLPVAAALVLVAASRKQAVPRLVAGGVVLAIMGGAIVLTEARGPGGGAIVALGIVVAAVWFVVPRYLAKLSLIALGLGISLAAALVIAVPGDDADADGGTGQEEVAGDSAADRGLTGRVKIWEASLDLVVDRPWFSFDDRGPVVLRHLVGYGPGTFVHAYPLREDPKLDEVIVLTNHAHNQHLNALIELGVLGLLAALAVTIVPLVAGGLVLLRQSRRYPWEARLLLAALLGSFAGHTVEQLVGVTQLTDGLFSWVVLGMLVALPRTLQQTPADEAQVARWQPVATAGSGVVVLTVLGSLVVLLSTQVLNPVLASRDSAFAVDAVIRGDRLSAVESMTDAILNAPAVGSYRLGLVALVLIDERSGASIDDQRRSTADSIAILATGLQRNRLSIDMNAKAASLLQTLSVDLGDRSQIPSAIAAFERTEALFPYHWQPKRNLGAMLLDAGLPVEALEPLTEALDMLGEHPAAANVLLLHGLASVAVGLRDQAEASFREGLRLTTSESQATILRQALETLGVPVDG
jgi:O-antigen ligase